MVLKVLNEEGTAVIYYDKRMVGKIRGDAYVTWRTSKAHYYRKGQGYPITNEVLHELKKRNVKRVVIIEKRADDSSRAYETTLQEYLDAVMITEGDFEPQRCVPLKQLKIL